MPRATADKEGRWSPPAANCGIRRFILSLCQLKLEAWASRLLICQGICNVVFVLLLLVYRKPALSQQAASRRHAFDSCLSAAVHPLTSFDPFINDVQLRWRSVHNVVETRFQETVWHTVRGNAVFPSASDMPWRLEQYSSVLPYDVRQVHTLARYIVGVPSIARMEHKRHDIKMSYMHFRVDRLRGLQVAAHFHVAECLNETLYDDDDDRNVTHTGPSSSLLQTLSVIVYVQRSFESPVCHLAAAVRPMREHGDDPSHTVYILLPYHARPHRLQMFVANFLHLRQAMKHPYDVILLICVVRHDNVDVQVVSHLRGTIESHKDAKIRRHAAAIRMSLNDGDASSAFSRAVALLQASREAASPDSILFHCDVDVLISVDFIPRCVENAIPQRQIYFPVMYSLYAHAVQPVVAERNGFWRVTSYGMVCVRRRDFDAIGAFADAGQQFRGWGGEDVHQFEQVRVSKSLVALRAIDPGMVHLWHAKACTDMPVSAEFINCMKTNFMTLGHPLHLGPALLKTMGTFSQLYAELQHGRHTASTSLETGGLHSASTHL